MKIWVVQMVLMLPVWVSCQEGKNKRVDAKPSAVTTADTTLKWIDYHIGELPPVGYYDAFDSVIKKWHIRYERLEGGCEATPEERARYERNNPRYFKLLEKRFGKNWLERFHAEVEEQELSIAQSNKKGS